MIANEKYECVVGARRTIGAKELGWETIEATIREMTDLEAIYASFSENIKRVDLNPIELGKMFKSYAEYLNSEGKKKLHSLRKISTILTTRISEDFEVAESSVRD